MSQTWKDMYYQERAAMEALVADLKRRIAELEAQLNEKASATYSLQIEDYERRIAELEAEAKENRLLQERTDQINTEDKERQQRRENLKPPMYDSVAGAFQKRTLEVLT